MSVELQQALGIVAGVIVPIGLFVFWLHKETRNSFNTRIDDLIKSNEEAHNQINENIRLILNHLLKKS